MKAFVNNRTDLVAYKAQFKDNWENLPLISASLDALDHAKSIGFKKLQLVTFDDDTIYKSRYHDDLEANYLARVLDAEIGHIISQELELARLAIGWTYLNLYYMIYCSLRMRRLGFEFNKILENEELLVHVPSNDPYLYFDSWLQKSVFMNTLDKPKTRQLKSNGLSKAFNPDFEYNFEDFTAKTLVHIPTIFYEQVKVSEKILASEPCMHLPSQFWDINLGGSRADLNLSPIKTHETVLIQKQLAEKLLPISKKLKYKLNLNDWSLNLTNIYLSKTITSQINLFAQLSKFNNLSNLIVSDHDTSIHGPLMTYAEENNLAVDVFPHSYVCTGPLPDTSLTTRHGLLRDVTSFNSLSGYKHKHLEKTAGPQKKNSGTNILVLLPELEDSAGVPIDNVQALTQFLRKFLSNCASKGYSVLIRPKPHHSYSNLISLGTKFAGGKLENWYDWPAIVVGIGTPTTALAHFANTSVTYHAQTTVLSELELGTLHTNTQTVVLSSWDDVYNDLTQRFTS